MSPFGQWCCGDGRGGERGSKPDTEKQKETEREQPGEGPDLMPSVAKLRDSIDIHPMQELFRLEVSALQLPTNVNI